MIAYIESHTPLLLCLLACTAVTVLPRIFYQGNFSPNPLENLFLMAAICTLLFSVITKNFFGTIVFAMAFVAGMRYLGWMV